MINGSRTYVGQILNCCLVKQFIFKFDMWSFQLGDFVVYYEGELDMNDVVDMR